MHMPDDSSGVVGSGKYSFSAFEAVVAYCFVVLPCGITLWVYA